MKKPYTKRGDKGKTDLIGNIRISKNSPRIEALGTIDELNSLLGVVISFHQKDNPETQLLKRIQIDLIEISSLLANPKSTLSKNKWKEKIKHLEKDIDDKTISLPQLNQFVIPGENQISSLLQLSRTVCRRTERRVVTLSQKEKINPQVLIYLNRLSDLLFVLGLNSGKKALV